MTNGKASREELAADFVPAPRGNKVRSGANAPAAQRASRAPATRMTAEVAEATGADEKAEGFGASHTSFYTEKSKKDSYRMLPEVLEEHCANPELREVITTLLNACANITEQLRTELVFVHDEQNSAFGDVQLGVDVLADNLMWELSKESKLIKEGASEEEPDVRMFHEDGKYSIVWDPLDGSSIVDNNWAVGTIIGVWPASTGISGATGRDQATSIVALYGPRTVVFVALDDGVYEFTYGANGADGWVDSGERIHIREESKIFSPGNMRAAAEVAGYDQLINYWKDNKYTLRYTGGLVPDICQQFTKGMGIFANPASKESPAKLRLAFEAAPFGLLVEKAGGKTSNGVDGKSILDTKIEGIDQRTPLAIGSAKEVDRFNEMVLGIK
jgi:sedoheptulose-bisphosphatase